jgi:predicted TIM-barrel fold metal-dependent hydrolase
MPEASALPDGAVVVDADGHVLEPVDTWQRYMEPELRDRAIRLEHDGDGLEVLLVDGKPLEMLRGVLGSLGGIGMSGADLLDPGRHTYADGSPPGGYDPKARLAVMDEEQIDVCLLYPTIGLCWEDAVRDAELATAYTRAYNRWIVDFCADSGGRLHPVAHISLLDADLAVAEAERARRDGCVGIYLSADHPTRAGRQLNDPAFDRFWSAAQALEMPVGFHVIVRSEPDFSVWTESLTDAPSRLFYHAFLAIDVMAAFTQMMATGIFERFPRLKCSVLEAGSNWISAWLDRLDHKYEVAPETYPLEMLPSEYFKRQCVISSDPDESMTGEVARRIGPEYCIWASDYPHIDASFGVVPELMRHIGDLDEAAQRAILGENALRFYGLERPLI